MLEFLIGHRYCNNGDESSIIGFNSETERLKVKSDNHGIVERDIFNSKITFNIDYYYDWQYKLYSKLIEDGNVIINVLSTVSGDEWSIQIHRLKTNIDSSLSADDLNLISYVVTFTDEVKGEILTIQDKDDTERVFSNWIEQQIEDVYEFNSDSWDTIAAIVVSDAFISKDEIDFLFKKHMEMY